MYEASSLARNSTALATSEATPGRPSAILRISHSTRSGFSNTGRVAPVPCDEAGSRPRCSGFPAGRSRRRPTWSGRRRRPSPPCRRRSAGLTVKAATEAVLTMTPPPAADDVRDRVLAAEEHAGQRDGDRAVPLLHGGVGERGVERRPERVVVERRPAGRCARRRCPSGPAPGPAATRRSAPRTRLRRRRSIAATVSSPPVDVGDDDGRPLGGERQRGLAADARPGPGRPRRSGPRTSCARSGSAPPR